MLYSSLLSVASLVALVAAVPSELEKRADTGCYRSGLFWSDLPSSPESLEGFRSGFCGEAQGNYNSKQTFERCITVGNNHINFSTQNWENTPKSLSYDDCMSAFRIEMNACNRGSYQWHGSFWYYSDPNANKC